MTKTKSRNRKREPSALSHPPNETGGKPLASTVAADTARYEALAREHGADLSEEAFNEALKKIGKQKI